MNKELADILEKHKRHRQSNMLLLFGAFTPMLIILQSLLVFDIIPWYVSMPATLILGLVFIYIEVRNSNRIWGKLPLRKGGNCCR